MHQLNVRVKAAHQKYKISIGRGILEKTGAETRNDLGQQTRRIALISNPAVFHFYGALVVRSLRASGFLVCRWLLGDGERFKSLRAAEELLVFLGSNGLERSDAVVALGGGVVGDLAGFAAAVYMRGIPFIQVPTTLLAQIDASVGGKTGVNSSRGKNLVGAFHQPRAVIIDTETLTTLPPRELVAGWCESVKQGAVGSRTLFRKTTGFLLKHKSRRKALLSDEFEELIASQCAFKASIVEGDEQETTDRRDFRSRRILNFGHTIGHALEVVTRYRRFRHGEAVGYGMLAAGEISKNLGLLEPSELQSLREAVRLCGPLPAADNLDERTIVNALAQDKKSIGGRIQWVLLERIGCARIVGGEEISSQLLRASLRAGLRGSVRAAKE